MPCVLSPFLLFSLSVCDEHSFCHLWFCLENCAIVHTYYLIYMQYLLTIFLLQLLWVSSPKLWSCCFALSIWHCDFWVCMYVCTYIYTMCAPCACVCRPREQWLCVLAAFGRIIFRLGYCTPRVDVLEEKRFNSHWMFHGVPTLWEPSRSSIYYNAVDYFLRRPSRLWLMFQFSFYILFCDPFLLNVSAVGSDWSHASLTP